MDWLHLHLAAPMASFGGPSIDAIAPTDNFPSKSMMTGMLANALGWTRGMRMDHARLQERLIMAAMWAHGDPDEFVDYQTATLSRSDRTWTTRPGQYGVANRLSSAEATFSGSNQRWKHYHADMNVTVVISLSEPDQNPLLSDLEDALQKPARVLFIGRKACVPSAPMFQGRLQAETPKDALASLGSGLAFWPASDDDEPLGVKRVFDLKDFGTNLHGGSRLQSEGYIQGGQTQ